MESKTSTSLKARLKNERAAPTPTLGGSWERRRDLRVLSMAVRKCFPGTRQRPRGPGGLPRRGEGACRAQRYGRLGEARGVRLLRSAGPLPSLRKHQQRGAGGPGGKRTQRNRKTFHAHGLEELRLLKCLYYLKQFIRLMQILSKYQQHFSQS